MKTFYIIVWTLSLVILISCKSTTKSSTNILSAPLKEQVFIKKGMTFDEMNKSTKDVIFTEDDLKIEGYEIPKKFRVYSNRYEVYFKTYFTSLGTRYVNVIENGQYKTKPVLAHFYTKYFYIFQDDKLIWWGYLYELKRTKDEAFLDLAKEIENYYQVKH